MKSTVYILSLSVLLLTSCNDSEKTIDGTTTYGGGGSRVPMQNGGVEADADTMETTNPFDTSHHQ